MTSNVVLLCDPPTSPHFKVTELNGRADREGGTLVLCTCVCHCLGYFNIFSEMQTRLEPSTMGNMKTCWKLSKQWQVGVHMAS